MKTVASRLLDKLHKKSNGVVVRASSHKCVIDVLDHLKTISKNHIKKSYNDDYLVSTCFRKVADFSSEAEYRAYCRVNLIICVNKFNSIVDEITENNTKKISSYNLNSYSEIIRDYLYDIKPIVEYLESRLDPNYIFFSGGKNYDVHSMEVFRLSRQLAIQSAYRKVIHIDHKVGLIASTFCLRQALEVKFERIIGVAFYNQYGETPKLKHGFHYDFICKNMGHFEFPNTKFDLIKYIYDWCNGVVHKAYMPYIWQVTYAHELCSGLFAGGAMTSKGGFSANGGVRTKQNNAMKSNFIQHFCANYHHGIWSIEDFQQEAVTTYYP